MPSLEFRPQVSKCLLRPTSHHPVNQMSCELTGRPLLDGSIIKAFRCRWNPNDNSLSSPASGRHRTPHQDETRATTSDMSGALLVAVSLVILTPETRDETVSFCAHATKPSAGFVSCLPSDQRRETFPLVLKAARTSFVVSMNPIAGDIIIFLVAADYLNHVPSPRTLHLWSPPHACTLSTSTCLDSVSNR